jgi:hypothetical protein
MYVLVRGNGLDTLERVATSGVRGHEHNKNALSNTQSRPDRWRDSVKALARAGMSADAKNRADGSHRTCPRSAGVS